MVLSGRLRYRCQGARIGWLTRRLAYSSPMTTVHAANICMWLKRDLKYDPVKEEFINDDEANTFRSRAERDPWRL